MKKAEVYKLMDIIEDVKKIDSIILLHRQSNDDSKFMADQYESKKTKLIGSLIDELVAPSIQSPQSFYLIQQIIGKFYPSNDKAIIKYDEEISQLVAAI